jgi:hypothetical protein
MGNVCMVNSTVYHARLHSRWAASLSCQWLPAYITRSPTHAHAGPQETPSSCYLPHTP